MGCLLSHTTEQPLSPEDFRLIWNRCLSTDCVILTPCKKKCHPVFDQIVKDIDRTFPGHPYFNSPNNKRCFERVLQGFAFEFPKVGQTQGLNFVAGFLLITGFSEEESLKTLVVLCTHPQLMLIGLYEDEFSLVKLYCSMFWSLLKKTAPQAYSSLQAAGLPDELWIFQWFITLFLYSFPFNYILPLLSFIVVKRYFAIVRLAVGVVQCLEKYISGLGDQDDAFIECFQLMKTEEFCRKHLPVDEVIRRADKLKKPIVFKSLDESKEINWYRNYFALSSPRSKHEKRMEQLKNERQEFSAQETDSIRFTRLSSSMTILDSIQEQMVKKYDKSMYRSSVERTNTIFYSKLSNQCVGLELLQTRMQK